MDKRKGFVDKYKEKVEPIDIRKYQRDSQVIQAKEMAISLVQSRYTAPKGTAYKAQNSKKKPSTKLAALILAAAIGVGGLTAINHHNENQVEPANMITVQQDGKTSQSLGLNQDTVELFKKYDEYFENFDEKDKYNLNDEQIINMIDEIEDMHFSTVKEKMGNLIGEDPKHIKMYYSFEKQEGKFFTSIVAHEDTYNDNNSLPIFKKNQIPSELSDVIVQLEDLKNLALDVQTDKITKVKAVKKLKKLYEVLEKVAIGDFVKDEKGNISIINYEDKQITQQKEDKERD